MRRFWIFFLLLGLISATPALAQRKTRKEGFKEDHNPFGRKKKERKNQKGSRRTGGLFSKKAHSKGNADSFAGNRISGRKSFLSSIFGGRKSSNASLRKTKPAKKNEDRALFKRHRTNGKKSHESKLGKQNRKREKTRRRGNDVFARKKH
ncbi:MAG: hypothetical protein IAF38_13505 [Bacteroidia bacterium]|nr:hypothetical protein [Bacteroidia bacterium]